MKKIIQKLIAILAMVFLVNMSSWGQWGDETHDLSSLTQGGIFEYYAGKNPAIKVSSASTVAGPAYSGYVPAGGTFPVGAPGSYTVAPAENGVGSFFIIFFYALCQSSRDCVREHDQRNRSVLSWWRGTCILL